MPHRAARSCPPATAGLFAALLVGLLLGGACATAPKARPPGEDLVILLPDEQGKTGAIVVSGAGGERLLSEPRQAVTVSAGAPPAAPVVLTPEEVAAEVGPALSVLPPPPLQFLLFFEHDAAELTVESREKLAAVVRAVRERAAVDVSVVGHTDTWGSRRHNYRLGLERSKAVAALLAAEGLDPSIIEIASHGEDNLLVPTRDRVHEPRNRRVEVTVR
jgi:outer membrane protein OmpA-like peptidoglycan-associated protein